MHFNKSNVLTLLLPFLLLADTTLATPTWPEKLDARATESLDGTVYCGIFGSGDRTDASGLLTDLDAGANGKISKKGFIIPSGQCNRVTCWDTTGIYACNDGPSSITLSGNDIWAAANRVYKLCCTGIVDAWATQGKGISGQKFITGSGGVKWNAAIGYANCNSSPSIKPSAAGGWNVNPVCVGGNMDPYNS